MKLLEERIKKDGIIKEKILGNPIKKLCPIYELFEPSDGY